MAEQDFFGAGTAQDASRCERAIFVFLICYLVEALVRPAFLLGRSFVTRSLHLPAAGPWLRH